ncbi:MAG: phosphoribosylanthranilate isomerase [Clostridiales bacterium]|nr:phosphoribosylanthranilate isomerase [Clostridiales bacterium]
MTKIKICGITAAKDIEYVNEFMPDYAGFVMFFPKSKRNISAQTAKSLLKNLSPAVTSVAVTVSPSSEQIELAKECGFNLIQIHGEISDEVLQNSPLPVLRAFNVDDMDNFEKYQRCKSIVGYVFDAHKPGSGKTFDWSVLNNINCGDKTFILAGGLNPENVFNAVKNVRPDGVDVSSGVESDSGSGKDRGKIERFISAVRLADGCE